MYKILTLNNISAAGLDRLPRERYEVASEISHPDAILLRSYKMHDMEIPESVQAIGRAGAGVNNIPVDRMTEKGIPVFNAPGANANAVKELVIAGMLMAARNIGPAWKFASSLEGEDAEITRAVEAGKKNFVGFELPGRTLGVVGLGAIGVKICNAAHDLGMNVVGFDPSITVKSAWKLKADVEQALSIDDLLSRADFVTFHVLPLNEQTANMINEERIRLMPDNAIVLNFARNGIVDDEAVVKALDDGKLYGYVCDFPSNLLKDHARCLTLPHLGASTLEAEENCAIMVADEVRGWLEDGNIANSVNFPEINMPHGENPRLVVVNSNVPNMLGQISTDLAEAGLNILDMLNKSRGDIAVTLIDLEAQPDQGVLDKIAGVEGVLSVRCLSCNK
ncbi:phosphoglycerate dehydrogenase [Thiolapillus sp.]|uniref:phosphoglycerate dehydrogenase n=1 Tax=Thiolapillus sp. TaxID=2017437 RepID=UPI0025DFB277|nr:phosphoglycerate dehydrogenase [Thiolapillus sp.]